MVRVRLYTRQWCGYCTAAERLLDRKGIAYESIDTTGDRDLRRWLRMESGRSTVPVIFIDNVAIGGYEELRTLDGQGALERLIDPG